MVLSSLGKIRLVSRLVSSLVSRLVSSLSSISFPHFQVSFQVSFLDLFLERLGFFSTLSAAACVRAACAHVPMISMLPSLC